ncbi:PD-(D/E)XK nuclease family protein [Metabacillus fastidiosus]|uniref:PD-(D/E)XK nuclease family protein n=1 Tax=Metabacillus fastidiosus TaxID=1458 RepID=UPI003D28B85F
MTPALLPIEQEATKVNVQKQKWSYSRLSMFEGCERQYFYKYILELPYPSNPPMQNGKIFHTGIDLMIREGYSPSESLYYGMGVNGGLPVGEKPYHFISMLNKAYDRIPQLEYAEITSELHLEVKTTLGVVQCYIDLLIDDPSNDVLEIWDWKTSWHSFAADTHIQLALYAWLLKQTRGYVGSTFKGRLIFPRLGIEEDSEVEFTEEKLNEAKTWLVTQITKVQSKDPSNIEDWEMCKDRTKCDYCPFAARCAGGLLDGLPSTGEPKSQEEAELIGSYILAQEAALKKMKSGIKKWVEDHGEVPVGSGKWTVQQGNQNFKCEDVETLIDYAKRQKLDVKEAVKANTAILSKWLDEDDTGELKQIITSTKGRKSFKYVN